MYSVRMYLDLCSMLSLAIERFVSTWKVNREENESETETQRERESRHYRHTSLLVVVVTWNDEKIEIKLMTTTKPKK